MYYMVNVTPLLMMEEGKEGVWASAGKFLMAESAKALGLGVFGVFGLFALWG